MHVPTPGHPAGSEALYAAEWLRPADLYLADLDKGAHAREIEHHLDQFHAHIARARFSHTSSQFSYKRTFAASFAIECGNIPLPS